MAVIDGLGGVERDEYSVGDIILVPERAELNFGPSEDSDSIRLDFEEPAIVLGLLESGAIEVSLPYHPDFDLLFFHQPELKVSLQ